MNNPKKTERESYFASHTKLTTEVEDEKEVEVTSPPFLMCVGEDGKLTKQWRLCERVPP